MGCGEGNCNVYCKAPDKELGQLILRKPELPDGFQGNIFKGKVREGSCSVCDQLVHDSLTG